MTWSRCWQIAETDLAPCFLSLPVRFYWLECRHAHSFILRSKVLPNGTSRTGYGDETLWSIELYQ